ELLPAIAQQAKRALAQVRHFIVAPREAGGPGPPLEVLEVKRRNRVRARERVVSVAPRSLVIEAPRLRQRRRHERRQDAERSAAVGDVTLGPSGADGPQRAGATLRPPPDRVAP